MVQKVLVHNYFKWNEFFSWIAWLIRLFTGKYYNHAGLRIRGICGEWYYYEATWPKSRIILYDKWLLERPRDVKLVNVKIKDREHRHKIWMRMWDRVDVPYDVKGLFIDMPLYLITGKWKGHTGKFAEAALYCYEAIADILEEPEFWHAMPE